MRNRAKCALCNDIIESAHDTDYVPCKCNEIAVDGGPNGLRCYAKDFKNFLRIDEKDNPISVKLNSENNKALEFPSHKPSKKDLVKMLDGMIEGIESLPSYAMSAPITHYDFLAALQLMSAILRDDCNADS